MTFSQVGELASSKSAMNTFAPELSALMTILRSDRPGDLDAAIAQVGRDRRDRPRGVAHRSGLGQEVEPRPRVDPACRSSRRRNNSSRRGPNWRCNVSKNSSASGVRIAPTPGEAAPRT